MVAQHDHMAIVGLRCAANTLCMLTAVVGGAVLMCCDMTRQAVTLAIVCWQIGSACRPPPEQVAAFLEFQKIRVSARTP